MPTTKTSQRAAGNKPPKGGAGNSQKTNETNDRTRQSDGKRPSEGASRKTKGAGPALARHSKDA